MTTPQQSPTPMERVNKAAYNSDTTPFCETRVIPVELAYQLAYELTTEKQRADDLAAINAAWRLERDQLKAKVKQYEQS